MLERKMQRTLEHKNFLNPKIKNQKSKLPEGFTLIELVIVVAIMSLLIFASLPTFHQFIASSRLRQGCYDIISALRTAKSQAITERIEFATLMYTFQGLWSATQVYCTEDPDRGMVTPWKRLPENIVINTSNLKRVEGVFPGPTSGSNPDIVYTITFNSRGGTEESSFSGNLEITLKDKSTQNEAVIKILQSTGRIYLFSFKGQMVQE